MARARNIKPGFFKNEELVELPYETRLLFIGLWTIADREGRLEDRPKRIKMELFPADNIDIDECLNQLQGSEFILRYTVGEQRYIQVLAFTKHQNPHVREAASTIPAPGTDSVADDAAQDQHSADTMQASGGNRASHADSLNSDSGNTDSLIPGRGGARIREIAARAAPTPHQQANVPSSKPKASPISADFHATKHMVGWALQHTSFSESEIERETAQFRDYWQGEGKSKVDWVATWRKWMREESQKRERGIARHATRGPDSGHVPRPPDDMTEEEQRRFYLRDVLERRGA